MILAFIQGHRVMRKPNLVSDLDLGLGSQGQWKANLFRVFGGGGVLCVFLTSTR